MTPNDTLHGQCRREAEEWYPDNIRTEIGSTASDGQLGARIGYAAALFHERSKPRTSLSVEEVMEVVKEWIEWAYDDDFDEQPTLRAGLRERLTAKMNELNTTDNG